MAVGSLGNNFRQLEPIAWSKGFAALEDTNGRAKTLWISPDGRTWTSSRLPVTVSYGAVLAVGDRLVLTKMLIRSRGSLIELWSSADGRHWTWQGEIPAYARTRGYFFGASVVVLRDRLAVLGSVGLYSSGGARPGSTPPSAGQASSAGVQSATASHNEMGMWILTSSKGTTWARQRMRGLGADSLGFFTADAGGYVGIRSGPQGNFMVRSQDAIHWQTLGPVPADVDLDAVVGLVASDDGYVLAADTGTTRGTPNSTGPRLTIWQVSRDGAFTEVFDRVGWQLTSLASHGTTVIMAGEDGNASDAMREVLALVSTDGGATFALSAGWPAMAASNCLGSIAIHGHTAVAGSGCELEGAPEILVADLP